MASYFNVAYVPCAASCVMYVSNIHYCVFIPCLQAYLSTVLSSYTLFVYVHYNICNISDIIFPKYNINMKACRFLILFILYDSN